jgi:hypothetical protein
MKYSAHDAENRSFRFANRGPLVALAYETA